MRVNTDWEVIDQVASPVLILDGRGEICHANPALLDLIGLPGGEAILGHSFSSLLEESQQDAFEDFFSQLSGDQASLRTELRNSSGPQLDVRVTARLIPDWPGSREYAVLTLEGSSHQQDRLADSPPHISYQDMKWLADQGRLLLSCNRWDEILDTASRALHDKLPDCVLICLTLVDDDTLRLDGYYGLEDSLLGKLWNLLGGDLHGRLYPIDERFRNTYSKRRLYQHPGGLAEFARSQVSARVSSKIEQLVGIENIYTIGLETDQEKLGCFYLFTRRKNQELSADLIESYTFQVALALQKTRFADRMRRSEKQFRTIFEYAPDGYYLCDLQGYFLDGNLAAEKITGYDRSELVGKSIITAGLISKDQLPKASKLLARNLLGKSTGPDDFNLTRKDGSVIPVEISTHSVVVDGKSVILGIARDISSRINTQKDIRQAHETLTRVLEGVDAHVYVAEMDTNKILYMNRRMIEDFGGDYTGRVCYEVFTDLDQRCSHCTMDQILDERGDPGDVVIWEGFNQKTGRWYKNYDRAIFWSDQQLVKLQIAIDITDNIQASRALMESENRYRGLFENSNTALMTLAPPDWQFSSANSATLDLFNIDGKQQFAGLDPWQLSPEHQPDGELSSEKALKMLRIAAEQGSHFFKWTHKKLTGEEFPATVQLSRVDLEEEYLIQAAVVDISEELEAESLLLRQMAELSLMNRINSLANRGSSLQEIMQVFGEETRTLFQALNVHVYLLDEEQDQLCSELISPDDRLQNLFNRELPGGIPDQIKLDLISSNHYAELLTVPTARVITEREIVQEMLGEFLAAIQPGKFNSAQLSLKSADLFEQIGFQAIATAPLISDGKTIGLVDLVLGEHFTEQELNTLRMLADQLSGIIGRSLADQERNFHLNEVELISRSLEDSAQEDDLDLLCNRLAENVQHVNPDAYVMVSLYDPELNAIRVRALKGLSGVADRLIQVLGKKPDEIVIDVQKNPLPEELNTLFTSGKLEKVPGGLYDLTRGVLPQRVCRTLEKIGGVGDVYIAGFGLQGVSTGGLVLLVKQGKEIHYPSAIENIANHYAVIFERRLVQQEVFQRKAQLEALRDVEFSITTQLNLDKLLATIAEKARQMVSGIASGFSILNQDRNVLEFLAYTGPDELPANTDIGYGEGLAGKVWESQQTILIDNYSDWEGKNPEWSDLGNYNMAGIPVVWGEELLGVLEIALDLGVSFTPGDIDTLELFATQAAIAIKNARLYADEQMRRQEAENLREVGLLINQMIDQEDLLEGILSSLKKVVPYEQASLQLVYGSECVVEAFVGGEHPEQSLGSSYPIRENPITEKLLVEGSHVILNNRKQIEEQLAGLGMEGIQSWLAVPLEIKGNRVGMITLDHSRPNQYGQRDARLLTDFATQAAIALENNRLFNEIRRRTREIEIVYESALKITQELQPRLLFEYLYQQIKSLVDLDSLLLATYDVIQDQIKIEFSVEDGERQLENENLLIPAEGRNSLLSWIVRKKVPLRIGNVERDSLPVPPRQAGETIRSWLGVPLLVGERVIGAMAVQSYQAQAYSKDDQRLLELLANQAAVALENSRLWEDAQTRLSRLASLREIDMAISGSVDLEMTMDVLLSQLLDTLDVDAACVLDFDPLSQTLKYVKAKGFRTKSLQHTSLKIGQGMAGRAALERKLVHIPDLRESDTSLSQSPYFDREGYVTYLAHPLIAKGELVGVLEVFHRERLDPDSEWINFLDALARVAAIAIERLDMFNNLSRSNIELQQAYDATIQGWARAIELRDMGTSKHSQRVVATTMNLARKLGLRGAELTHIRRGAMLHDIGKMAIPDGILLKQGKLSEDEWTLMKKHPQYAYDMLSRIDYLRPALDIPYCHHERWDGSGYPRGLSGEDIPLAARIFAIVDVWDALQSDRPYRDAWTEEKVIQYLRDQAGQQFDPQIVKVFLELIGNHSPE